jgi:hypothetical protein
MNLTASDNTISNTAVEFRGAAAIFAGFVLHTTIEHNSITNTSNGGIVLGYGFGIPNCMKANIVRHNKISRSEAVLYDTGSIYTLSAQPGSVIYGNYIEDQVLLYGSLYHDQSSAGFTTHSNVVLGGKMWIYLQWGAAGPVSDLLIAGNFHSQPIAGGCGSQEHAPTCPDNVTVQDNILVLAGRQWPPAARAIISAAGVRRSGSTHGGGRRAAMALVERRPDHMTRDQDHLPQTVADVSKEMHAATAFVRHHGCFSPHGLPALKYSGSNVSAALAMIVDGAAGSFDVCGMRQMTTDFRQVAVTHSQHLLVAGEAQPLPPRLTAAFYVTGTLNLTQLRFSNQDISAAGGDNTGGGIYLGGGGALSAAGVVFANLSASHGGAVFVGDGSAGAVFTECTFVGNKATAVWGGGGAMAVFPGAAAVFMRCRFAQNKAHLGGAIWSNGAVHVELCAFDGNAATARGGGLVAADGSAAALNISSSSFVRTLRY